MINRNIQMKKKNEDQWENLFPLTLNENVFNNEGLGLTKQLNNLRESFNNKIDEIFINVKKFGAIGDGETDDTKAIQDALNSFDRFGGTLFFPKGLYLVSEPLIFPNIIDVPDSIKSIRILGTNGHSARGTYSSRNRGSTAFRYIGTGALFELRNGKNDETRNLVSFENFNAYGDKVEGSYGINAYEMIGGKLLNVSFSNFDTNIKITGSVYYTTFDRAHSYGAINYGYYLRTVNGTTLRDSMVSQNRIGLYLTYGGVAVNIDSSWFENNDEYGIQSLNTQQLNIYNSYFERNGKAPVIVRAYEELETATVNSVNSNYTLLNGSQGGMVYHDGVVNFNLINSTITTSDKDLMFISRRRGELANVYCQGVSFINEKITIANANELKISYGLLGKDEINIGRLPTIFDEHIFFNRSGYGLRFGNSNTSTIARLADFPSLIDTKGTIEIFRQTNTTDDVNIDIHSGTGQSDISARIEGKTGEYTNFKNGKGIKLRSDNGTFYTLKVSNEGELLIE